MRVLYITLNPNRQSTTVPTEGWFRLLRPRGLEPVLVSSQSGDFQAWVEGQGIPSYRTPLPFPNVRSPWPFLRSLLRLVRIGRRHQVQLVHCNEQDVYPIGQYAARLLGVPVVVSVHFTLPPGFSRWAFQGRRAPDLAFFLSRGSLEASRPGIDDVLPEGRRRLLYNGIDLERFRPDAERRVAFRREHGLQDAIAVGVACALRPRKQLEHLFAAVRAADVPRLRVVVAGGPVPGDEEYAANLMTEARRSLGDALVYLGHQSDLRSFYNGLDLFVNTSQEEACSISVIEALASGLPVVGYPSTSVDEQVLPDGGEIVEQDSVEQLAGLLRRRTASLPALAEARQLARARAEAVFDIRRLSDQLWNEYTALLGAGDRVG